MNEFFNNLLDSDAFWIVFGCISIILIIVTNLKIKWSSLWWSFYYTLRYGKKKTTSQPTSVTGSHIRLQHADNHPIFNKGVDPEKKETHDIVEDPKTGLPKYIKKQKSKENIDLYSYFSEALKSYKNKEFQKAVDNFDMVIDNLPEIPEEILSTTAFASKDDVLSSFTLQEVYHNRGCAKMMIQDVSSINDFTKAINLNENYEEAYYMRGTANFILLEDWQLALPDIKKYLKFSPDDKAGNNMLLVLEEIKKNSSKVSKYYKIGVSEYSKAEKLLHSDKEEEAILHLNTSKENLEKAINLYSQKNRVYMYQKSHSFSLCDIYFKKLQCNLQLGGINVSDKNFSLDQEENPMTECMNIYELSKGKFKPKTSDLGASLYYTIVDQAK